MQKNTLLLVDNSQVLMDLTKKILERAGYSVRCAVGITDAQEQLMDFAPDGIILESDLPDGKGLDFCCELRKESDIPIMFLSNDKEDELPALEAGANDFLKKPFDYAIIKARINVMLDTGVLFQMDKSAKPYMGADQFNFFPSVENTKIRANATDVKMLLLNPESNACYFTFEIVLADTGESLYLSDLVGPGMRIEKITLSRGLAKSKYAAIIKICAYALEDFTPMNGADVNVTLTVT